MNDPSIGLYGSVMSTNLTPRSPWAVIKAYVDVAIWMVAIEFGAASLPNGATLLEKLDAAIGLSGSVISMI